MPPRSTPLLPECYYHIYNKVVEGAKLFYSNHDFFLYLQLWQEVDFTSCCRLEAYCLMPTHYHYLVKMIYGKQFSKKLSYLFNIYLKTINNAQKHQGRFFSNRFQSRLVDNSDYLIHLCGYIHLNPIEAGLVKDIEKWPFSNYLEFAGKRNGKLWDPEFFTDHFSDHSTYEEFLKNKYDNEGLDKYIFKD